MVCTWKWIIMRTWTDNGLDNYLSVQLVELVISEHMVPLSPGHPQLVKTGAHLSRFDLRSGLRLKLNPGINIRKKTLREVLYIAH